MPWRISHINTIRDYNIILCGQNNIDVQEQTAMCLCGVQSVFKSQCTGGKTCGSGSKSLKNKYFIQLFKLHLFSYNYVRSLYRLHMHYDFWDCCSVFLCSSVCMFTLSTRKEHHLAFQEHLILLLLDTFFCQTLIQYKQHMQIFSLVMYFVIRVLIICAQTTELSKR